MSDLEDVYQTLRMQDFERSGDPRLVEVDYLQGMFDLEILNRKDEPIVITLREKPAHFTQRQEGGNAQARETIAID